MTLVSLLIWAFVVALCAADNGYWPIETFKTERWGMPKIVTRTYGETAPGLLFICPNHINKTGKAPMIVQPDGELVWRYDRWEAAWNVDHQMLNGKPVLTWWEGQHDTKGYGCGYGGVRILDDTYTQIHHICGAHLDVNPVDKLSQPCKLDTHESRITPRGTLLATVRTVIPADLRVVGGPKNGWLLDSVFYELEIPSEKVLMRWSTYEHRHQFPALTISHLPINTPHNPPYGVTEDFPWDFAHMNSVATVPAPANGYIVSCRYLWSAIKVADNGNVEWYLEGSTGGSFTTPRSANFSFQHDVLTQYVTSTSMELHMFDNSNNELTEPQQPSSGLLLHLDLEHKTVKTLQRFSPRNETSSTHTGGYQPLYWKEHVLVCFGEPPILNEFDGDGKVVWTAQVANLQGGTYRAYKKAWTGHPKTSPKVAAQQASGGSDTTMGWVSWNGATEVDRWQFWGRKDVKDALHFLEEVPKHGFETPVQLEGKFVQVKAKALHLNGTVLGESNTADVVKHGAPSSISSRSSWSSWLVLAVSVIVVALC